MKAALDARLGVAVAVPIAISVPVAIAVSIAPAPKGIGRIVGVDLRIVVVHHVCEQIRATTGEPDQAQRQANAETVPPSSMSIFVAASLLVDGRARIRTILLGSPAAAQLGRRWRACAIACTCAPVTRSPCRPRRRASKQIRGHELAALEQRMTSEHEEACADAGGSANRMSRRRLRIAGRSESATDAPAVAGFRRYSPRPGHPDWPRLQAQALAIARHVLPGLESPSAARDRRRKLASFATAARNHLVNRRLDRAGREDLRPLYFIWTLLRSCNFSCSYCDDHRGNRYPELSPRGALSTEGGIRLLETMRTGTSCVYFAGGEPTLRKDLPELTRAAHGLDYYPIIINTNGSIVDRRLRHHRWRTWLADTDIVVVSLDALNLDVLKTMWRSRDPEAVIRNLLLLRELADPMGFKLMVNTVIQPGMISHARDVLDFANDMDIGFCPVPMNVGPRVDQKLASDPAYAALAATILERKADGYAIAGSVRMNRRLLQGTSLNCRNTLKPHIDHDGKLFWPCKASVNTPPVRLDVLAHRDVESLYEAGRRLVDPTGFQGPGPEQCGASCNWAQNYSTDAYLHGLRHPAQLLRDVFGFLDRT